MKNQNDNAALAAPPASQAGAFPLAHGSPVCSDAEILLGEIEEFRRKVRDLNRDIDAGHEMNIDRWPWRTTKGRRVTLKNVRERLHYLEQRMDQVFKANT